MSSFRHDTRRRKRASIFDPYAPYVLERWQAGCHNSLHIWRELVQRGFMGSYPLVHRFLNRLRHLDQHAMVPILITPTALPVHSYTLTQIQWLLTWFPEELHAEEREDVQWLCAQDLRFSANACSMLLDSEILKVYSTVHQQWYFATALLFQGTVSMRPSLLVLEEINDDDVHTRNRWMSLSL